MGGGNSKINTSNLQTCTSNIEEWMTHYGFSDTIYNKYYIPMFGQEIFWFVFMTLTGILGQILFRLYYMWEGINTQWWWLILPHFWYPLYGIIPAFSLCVNLFWINYFEELYNSIDYDNSDNLFHFLYLVIQKILVGLVIIIAKPSLLPLIYFDEDMIVFEVILRIIIIGYFIYITLNFFKKPTN